MIFFGVGTFLLILPTISHLFSPTEKWLTYTYFTRDPCITINVFNLLTSVSETSTITTMDLPPTSRVPLPLELNCELFKCLKLPVQRKFIWGLGRDIYEIFVQKLLKKVSCYYIYFNDKSPYGHG
jgi:hypothetical protein